MALDDYTRALRRNHLGSSDAAAIVGRSPWASAFDVWAEKTGKIPDVERTGVMRSPAIEAGTYLEPGILDWAQAQLQTPFTRSVFRESRNGFCCANFDAVSFDLPAIVEAKTAGLLSLSQDSRRDWGEPYSDDVPEHVLLQVHHQFAIALDQDDWPRMTVAFVPVLLGGVGLVMYRVEANPDLCDALRDREQQFWQDYVLADVAPPDVLPSHDTIARYLRQPGKQVAVDAALVAAWRLAQTDATDAKKRADLAQRQLLATLGDAESGVCDLGVVTYKEQTRAAYAVEASTYRVARFTAARPRKDA